MEESPIDRIRRLNRERQARWYLAHKNDFSNKQKENRQLFRTLLAEYREKQAQTPPPPQNQPQRITIRVPRPKNFVANLDNCLEKLGDLDTAESTKNKYKNDLKTIHYLTNFTDLNKNLLNDKLFIKKLIDGKQKKKPTLPYGTNSVKGFLQCICYVFDKLYLDIPKIVKDKYRQVFDEYKKKSKKKTETEQTSIQNSVMNAGEFLKKCETQFGRDSKEYLICRLYKEVICRDNFGRIMIVNSKQLANDIHKNYIIIPKTRANCSIILNNYKTSKKYNSFETGLSAELSALLKNYCKKLNLDSGNFLFSEDKLSGFIGVMLKKLMIDGKDAINYLRHMFISNQLQNTKMSEAERNTFARDCFHSVVSNLKYVRQII